MDTWAIRQLSGAAANKTSSTCARRHLQADSGRRARLRSPSEERKGRVQGGTGTTCQGQSWASARDRPACPSRGLLTPSSTISFTSDAACHLPALPWRAPGGSSVSRWAACLTPPHLLLSTSPRGLRARGPSSSSTRGQHGAWPSNCCVGFWSGDPRWKSV